MHDLLTQILNSFLITLVFWQENLLQQLIHQLINPSSKNFIIRHLVFPPYKVFKR